MSACGRYQTSNLRPALRQFGLAPFTNSDGDRIDNSKDSLTESFLYWSLNQILTAILVRDPQRSLAAPSPRVASYWIEILGGNFATCRALRLGWLRVEDFISGESEVSNKSAYFCDCVGCFCLASVSDLSFQRSLLLKEFFQSCHRFLSGWDGEIWLTYASTL